MTRLLAFIAFVFFTVAGTAQVCTPDTSLKDIGIYPDSLPPATVGEAYDEVVQIIALQDTIVEIFGQPILINIDSIVLVGIQNLPTEISYTCNPPSCGFIYPNVGCMNFTGTVTDNSLAGTYNLIADIKVYSNDLAGLGMSPSDETLDFGNFTVIPGVGIVEGKSGRAIQFSHKDGKVEVRHFGQHAITQISVFDVLGKPVLNEQTHIPSYITTSFEVNIPSGVYFAVITQNNLVKTIKFLVR